MFAIGTSTLMNDEALRSFQTLGARRAARVSSYIALSRQPNQHHMVDEPQITEQRPALRTSGSLLARAPRT